jgi:hypothetical protein
VSLLEAVVAVGAVAAFGGFAGVRFEEPRRVL